MAAFSGADSIPDRDFSSSHRHVPIPSISYNDSQSGAPPLLGQQAGKPVGKTFTGDAASMSSGRKRAGSFKFLRRSSSNNTSSNHNSNNNTGDQPSRTADIVPETRASSSHQRAQSTPLGSAASYNQRKISGEAGMLRKHSKQRQQQLQLQAEQDRVQREAQLLSRPPPRLPSHNPLPQMTSFGGEDTLSTTPSQQTPPTQTHNAYTDSGIPPAIPTQSNHTYTSSVNNFSRPAVGMPPGYQNYNDSSSPAYLAHSGNAFAQTSSSPSIRPGNVNGGGYVDHMPRSESMTNRSRYSYASTTAPVNVNSPRRIRRRKDPTPFNVLVVGAKNSGKSSFIDFLKHSFALPPNKSPTNEPLENAPTTHATRTSFSPHFLETEIESERIGLTLWDSAGLEKNVVDLQLREIVSFIESKFEETFNEEQKITRSPGVKDPHIHCVFVMLDPIRLDATVAASNAFTKGGVHLASSHGLDDDLDLQVFRALWGKTTVIPVIAKADTLTLGHIAFLKRAVWASLQGAKLDPLEALELEEDAGEDEEAFETETSDGTARSADPDSDAAEYQSAVDYSSNGTSSPKLGARRSHVRNFSRASIASVKSASKEGDVPYLPMSILSPDRYELPPFVAKSKTNKNSDKIGRRYAWGVADPYNPDHCDFMRLRDSIFSEWRTDLRELSRSKWYENWRTSRLNTFPGSRQRVKGGVTPLAAVPREGRSSPNDVRSFTPAGSGGGGGAAAAAYGQQLHNMPRSVSGAPQQHVYDESVGVAVTTPGIDPKVTMGSTGGNYR